MERVSGGAGGRSSDESPPAPAAGRSQKKGFLGEARFSLHNFGLDSDKNLYAKIDFCLK